ncbi:MAG: class I SAM-dependent methyltransferase [Candidatus Beckwithbacteria bacterium]|nr:class I SAM-dependent methyltransferase [Candidatus Beckwithbacteria bacterium]
MNFDQATNLWRGVEVALLKQNWGKYFKGKILDLGCGEGEIARQVFGRKIEWGLDNDLVMVRKAKQSGMYNQVLLGDARKIALASGRADLVFSNSVIEHIQNLDKVLPEINRVLRQGGLLVATMPSDCLGEYLGRGEWYARWFNRKYQHYNLLSKEKWIEMLKIIRFKLIDGYYYLDKQTIHQWHKLLWGNKLGIKLKVKPVKPERLKIGAGIAILAQKI